jgi:hypothetical protein
MDDCSHRVSTTVWSRNDHRGYEKFERVLVSVPDGHAKDIVTRKKGTTHVVGRNHGTRHRQEGGPFRFEPIVW